MVTSAHLGLLSPQFLFYRCDDCCPVMCPILGAGCSFQTEVTRTLGKAEKAPSLRA